MKNRIIFASAGALGMALLCGAAMAQDYSGYTPYYDRHVHADDAYDRATAQESVTVRPYDRVQKRQLIGRFNGEINPVQVSISRPVRYADLDLSRRADFRALHARVRDTARALCGELDARYPSLRDRDADRQCVRTATRNAMRAVSDHEG